MKSKKRSSGFSIRRNREIRWNNSENKDIVKLIAEIVAREAVLRSEIDAIIREIEE